MYFYIYDSFLSQKKYERTLAAVETRLTDLGISGKIGRLSPFTSARGLVRDEVRRGTQTVVAVGNDETVSKIVEGIGGESVTLGMIPIGSPVSIGESLGIPYGEEACDVLSKRVTQKIDLGRVNGRFFLSSLRIPGGKVTIVGGDGQYRITTPANDCEIVVSNLRSGDVLELGHDAASFPGDPMDGLLDALIMPRVTSLLGRRRPLGSSSVIPLRRLDISSDDPIDAIADGYHFVQEHLEIDVVPECLKVITGRERVFAQ
ncbi:MAG: diacylglycerol kinase family protein [bacterium]